MKTLINPYLRGSGKTLVNPTLNAEAALVPGIVVNERYRVLQKIQTGGEADIFLCTDLCSSSGSHVDRILKLYHRPKAVETEMLRKLCSISCMRIAKLYDVGTWRGCTYEVVEYCPDGSLEGRCFSPEELREDIIPQLVEAVHALHANGILHKDIKPANIMLRCSDPVDLALIDFGVASVRDEGTVLLAENGLTPEFAAPETFRGLYLEESDYYALGVTICSLFAGCSPYAGLDEEQVARMVALQRLPLPDNMPGEIADLIRALTYPDVSSRHEKENPNRRWGYDEVIRWLKGERQPVPGGRQVVFLEDFPFNGAVYSNLADLTEALIQNWEAGRAALSSGEMAAVFRRALPALAPLCGKAQEEAKGNGREDLAYMRFLYSVVDDPTRFVWQGVAYESTTAFGSALLMQLQSSSPPIKFCAGLLKGKGLSEYVAINHLQDTLQAAAIRALEEAWAAAKGDRTVQLRLYYNMAFLLSGLTKLTLDGHEIHTINELTLHLQELADHDYGTLQVACGHLITPDLQLVPQFEAWLMAVGQSDAVQQWLHTFHH